MKNSIMLLHSQVIKRSRCKNGNITICEFEAKVVRQIFSMYLSGIGSITIANHLNLQGIPSPGGNEWTPRTIVDMLKEDDIKALFIRAYSKLMSNRTALIEDCRLLHSYLMNFTEIEAKCKDLLGEMEVVSELVKRLINGNAATPMSQNKYIEKYDGYTERFNKAKAEYEKLQKTIEQRKIKAEAISGFMFELLELDELPIKFDEKLWDSSIDSVTVYTDERLVFKFKNGTEIEERL